MVSGVVAGCSDGDGSVAAEGAGSEASAAVGEPPIPIAVNLFCWLQKNVSQAYLLDCRRYSSHLLSALRASRKVSEGQLHGDIWAVVPVYLLWRRSSSQCLWQSSRKEIAIARSRHCRICA